MGGSFSKKDVIVLWARYAKSLRSIASHTLKTNLPPRFKTRYVSRIAATLYGTNIRPKWHTKTSNGSPLNGRVVASTCFHSNRLLFLNLRAAKSIIGSFKSVATSLAVDGNASRSFRVKMPVPQ